MTLGIKRTCPSCETKFYDLGKKTAACPKCGKTTDFSTLERKPAPAQPKAKKKAAMPAPKKVKVHLDETGEEIDLTPFADEVETDDDEEELEDVVEPGEEDIESLSALEDREREEDLLNSDDAEEESFIENMDSLETLIDQPEDEDEEDEDDDSDEDEDEDDR